jgi:hypothetical protein
MVYRQARAALPRTSTLDIVGPDMSLGRKFSVLCGVHVWRALKFPRERVATKTHDSTGRFCF